MSHKTALCRSKTYWLLPLKFEVRNAPRLACSWSDKERTWLAMRVNFALTLQPMEEGLRAEVTGLVRRREGRGKFQIRLSQQFVRLTRWRASWALVC